jgi:hypothetical protein
VFGNPVFYRSEQAAKLAAPWRAELFGGMTMKEVMAHWESPDKRAEIATKIDAMGGRFSRAENYLNMGLTIEDDLKGKVVPLNGPEEIDRINKRYVDLYSSARSGKTRRQRTVNRITYVLGPSGIGKTFFAARTAATYGWFSGTTLHIKTNKLVEGGWRWNDRDAINQLLRWIQKSLYTLYPKYKAGELLKLDLAIVLDDVFASSIRMFDEQRSTIDALYGRLHSRLVDPHFEARIFVCATGFTTVDSRTDPNFEMIRLAEWTREDLNVLVSENGPFATLGTEGIDSICQLSPLNEFATNPRTAWLLLEAVQKICYPSTDGPWAYRLSYSRGTIVGYVVDHYWNESKLKELDLEQLRRVTAWVFYTIEQSRLWSLGHQTTPYTPTTNGLNGKHADAALALVNLNYDRTDRLLDGELLSVSISPAILVVLIYVLCGTTEVLNHGWGLAQLTAWYALRQALLKGFWLHLRAPRVIEPAIARLRLKLLNEKFQKHTLAKEMDKRGQTHGVEVIAAQFHEFAAKQRSRSNSFLDNLLASLQLKQVKDWSPDWSPDSEIETFSVPVFERNVIWINDLGAPFADVVARYTLFKVVEARTQVPLLDELLQCGLLKPTFVKAQPGGREVKKDRIANASTGWSVLTGLCWLWDPAVSFKIDSTIACRSNDPIPEEGLSRSPCYPENAIFSGFSRRKSVHYLRLTLTSDKKDFILSHDDDLQVFRDGVRASALPCLSNLPAEVSFVLSYISDSILLSTNFEDSTLDDSTENDYDADALELTPSHMDDDGYVIEDSLDRTELSKWLKITSGIRENVRLKFVQF